MDTQNWKIQKIGWKLLLLISVSPLSNPAIANSVEFLQDANNPVTASEIEPNLLSIPTNILPERQSKLLGTEKTQQTPVSSDREDTLDFSDTGRAGQQSAAEARGRCGSSDFPLTALVPVSNWGKTVREYPTFWFYVPSNSISATEIEFVLQDRDRNNLSKQQLSADKKSHYLHSTLDKDLPGLKIGEWYRWYLKVYCDREKRYPPKVVYGWIRRVKMDSNLRSQLHYDPYQSYKVYGKAGIWFDAIDSLLQTYSVEKTSADFQQGWQQLITAKGVDLNLPQPKCSDFAIEP